jgi:predicted glycogen debranching enzyme
VDEIVRRIPWPARAGPVADTVLNLEWIVTNGLGGYASSTVAGVLTRRYHGLLIAALPAPLGRMVMLSCLEERLRFPDGTVLRIDGEDRTGSETTWPGGEHLAEFRLELGLPVWRYEARGLVFEKRLWLPHMQNTVHVTWTCLRADAPVELELRPAVHFRGHEAPVDEQLAAPYALTAVEDRYELALDALPPLRLQCLGRSATFGVERRRIERVRYRMEELRGYASHGQLWSPGGFRVELSPDHPAALVASTEAWETAVALGPAEAVAAERERRRRLLAAAHPRAREGLAAELVLAADQFIVTPAGRIEDAVRARAAGDEVRTVIAGYHWFTDWGRDTMIALEGLALVTGRHDEAGWILRTFAHYLRDGLLPNHFPEGKTEGLYNTADATLWYFHATDRYLRATGDRITLRFLLPKLREIVRRHLEGTRFGIGVDPEDGLLRQGAEGYQLTWMDAKVGDWVVTPRRGKAVEINALWYNALRVLEGWLREEGHADDARATAAHAERARASFNERFWDARRGHLLDVVGGERGDDPALRPNQLLSISLPHPVLDPARWTSVVEAVRDALVTPVGLRTLERVHPEYQAAYHGDLRARDAAYHQGTVWAWLIGPFIDAWLKVHPEDHAGARAFLEGFARHLGEAGVGSIAEICDAEPPFSARGCIAQAWSVAEVLRCWVGTAGKEEAGPGPRGAGT